MMYIIWKCELNYIYFRFWYVLSWLHQQQPGSADAQAVKEYKMEEQGHIR